MDMPYKLVVCSENPTDEELSQVAASIREALAVPDEVHNARWREYFASNGIPDPQMDPEGYARYSKARFDHNLAELNKLHFGK